MNQPQPLIHEHIDAATPHGELPEYRLGRQYAYCAVEALRGQRHTPRDAIDVGDQYLNALSDITDPELLRDFIAGVARGIEAAALQANGATHPNPPENVPA
ncbi:hypothetical protein [Nocardioides piscis]|uniref:Uncharacterized protein n=1 Tax=Nocardioides piscis TaxID=2714938 RepID=A0A6G7YD34_9ACTN|nr:hypothetical protein [Nocardioides piscis]QIK74703.1 hypothetical protein G7071_03975 [Nocardioides piscis]